MPITLPSIDNIPDLSLLWTGTAVTLPQVLDAREARVYRQQDLLARFQKPLVCFTMNIAGPIKNNELIRRGFAAGLSDLKLQLQRAGIRLLFEASLSEVTGNEAWLVADTNARTLKKLTCELEDRDDLGRLYDMDVLLPETDDLLQPLKMDRGEIGLEGRRCLLCGAPAKTCSSRRIHSVPELQKRTAEILYRSCLSRSADTIAEYAVRALLYEVSVTPKPGLVDRNNNGSHRDMDFYSFLGSSAALWPYFRACAAIGQETAACPPEETFRLLRDPGKEAELRMLRATGGVNTHKGAIFTLGIAAAAAGRLDAAAWTGGNEDLAADADHTAANYTAGADTSPVAEADHAAAKDAATRPKETETGSHTPADASEKTDGTSLSETRLFPLAILAECARMTKGLTAGDFASVTKDNAVTVGQKLYAEYGITGVRGQMEAGLPAVACHGLPLLKKLLAEGKSRDEAGAAVLINIIAHTTDTNLIHRSDIATQQAVAETAGRLIDEAESMCPEKTLLEELDRDYIRRNLSPGGSADLLAVCWFLHLLETESI